jgi:ArsR family metal-binding transcriptional regulator
MDAERDHAKSELEQFKVDIARAMKQKASLEKALGKKVIVFVFFLIFFMEDSCYSCGNYLCTVVECFLTCRKNHLTTSATKLSKSSLALQ